MYPSKRSIKDDLEQQLRERSFLTLDCMAMDGWWDINCVSSVEYRDQDSSGCETQTLHLQKRMPLANAWYDATLYLLLQNLLVRAQLRATT